ncbi:hypothetical protein AMTR_s00064p00118700 [Amborella trichopoda]|uniref:Uncharacterized protein n=1 Tax=Amborella trichopoda TaxID=13333 RepID=U5DC33_AMBTC|nr:hypothetical protein AMTR_s00064p00118700 [Amborella trichopoda]
MSHSLSVGDDNKRSEVKATANKLIQIIDRPLPQGRHASPHSPRLMRSHKKETRSYLQELRRREESEKAPTTRG